MAYKFKINGRERPINYLKYKLNKDTVAPSKGSDELKKFLVKHFSHHTLLEEFKIPSSLLRVDFIDWTLKVAFEYHDASDGHHTEFNKFFHKSRAGFLGALKRDIQKRDIMEDNGFLFVEIFKEDLPITLDKLRGFGVNC